MCIVVPVQPHCPGKLFALPTGFFTSAWTAAVGMAAHCLVTSSTDSAPPRTAFAEACSPLRADEAGAAAEVVGVASRDDKAAPVGTAGRPPVVAVGDAAGVVVGEGGAVAGEGTCCRGRAQADSLEASAAIVCLG